MPPAYVDPPACLSTSHLDLPIHSIAKTNRTPQDQTPGSATPAQTPGSGSASGNATPTSATVSRGGNKKKKADDESEPDSAPGNSKKRTAFGAVRK